MMILMRSISLRPLHQLITRTLRAPLPLLGRSTLARVDSRRMAAAWALAGLVLVLGSAMTAQEVPPPAGVKDVPALQGFTVAGTTTGYVSRDAFLTFIHGAEAGVKQQGLLDGRGPLAIVVLITLIVVVGNLVVDLLYAVLDPRVGIQQGEQRTKSLVGGVF
jgi:hypothetical protein